VGGNGAAAFGVPTELARVWPHTLDVAVARAAAAMLVVVALLKAAPDVLSSTEAAMAGRPATPAIAIPASK
jgi:hypothetical protein